MSYFRNIFKKSNNGSGVPDMCFGRHTDAFKNENHFEIWEASLSEFEKGNFLECYRLVIEYLQNDDHQNTWYSLKEDTLLFEILQGSKLIKGFANKEKFKARAKISIAEELRVEFLERLAELNYNLKYCRYALDDEDTITLIFDTSTVDGSPFKIYNALKELAINSDKQDDLLIGEFPMLRWVNTGHVKMASQQEKEVKYVFLIESINEVLKVIDTGNLDQSRYHSGISFLFLDLIYKLDYLLCAQGTTTEILERIHDIYFSYSDDDPLGRNQKIRSNLETLKARKKEEYFNEFYQVPITFGITSAVDHFQIQRNIANELPNMDWYENNGHTEVAKAIPGFIVGYCMFNYSLPNPCP